MLSVPSYHVVSNETILHGQSMWVPDCHSYMYVLKNTLECSRYINSSQRCLEGLTGVCAVHILQCNLGKPRPYGPHYVHSAIVILEEVLTS